MKKIILLFLVMISSVGFASEYYGCDEVALNYAAEEIFNQTGIPVEELKAIATIEVISFSETYGKGEFLVDFIHHDLLVETTLWDDYSCSVDE